MNKLKNYINDFKEFYVNKFQEGDVNIFVLYIVKIFYTFGLYFHRYLVVSKVILTVLSIFV